MSAKCGSWFPQPLAAHVRDQYDRKMTSGWHSFLRSLFAPPAGAAARAVRDVARFGIGFCPGCKRLRGAASLACDYCGSTRPVEPDA